MDTDKHGQTESVFIRVHPWLESPETRNENALAKNGACIIPNECGNNIAPATDPIYPTIQQSNNPTIQQSNNPTIQQSNNPLIRLFRHVFRTNRTARPHH